MPLLPAVVLPVEGSRVETVQRVVIRSNAVQSSLCPCPHRLPVSGYTMGAGMQQEPEEMVGVRTLGAHQGGAILWTTSRGAHLPGFGVSEVQCSKCSAPTKP